MKNTVVINVKFYMNTIFKTLDNVCVCVCVDIYSSLFHLLIFFIIRPALKQKSLELEPYAVKIVNELYFYVNIHTCEDIQYF